MTETERITPEKKEIADHLRVRHGRVLSLSYTTTLELRKLHQVLDPSCPWRPEVAA